MKKKSKILKFLNAGKDRGGKIDFLLLVIIFILLAFGLAMLSSASSAVAYSKTQNSYFYFNHQLVGLIFGLVAFWFFSGLDYHILEQSAFWFLLFSVLLLLLVFIPGLSQHYGKARSWIGIFGFSLQPSEFVKISFLLYLSAWLDRRKQYLGDYAKGIIPFVFILSIIGGLMLLQPDLGTLTIIVFTSLIVYFVGGGKITHIFGIILVGIIGFVMIVSSHDYQMNRIKCMLNDPKAKSEGKCYHINQSFIAVGSGGILGRGIGESRQKFMYIPEVSSDAIYAIIGEEVGFVFSSLLIISYVLLFWRGYIIGKYAPDGYGRILAIGIVSWVVLQAFINIGGIIGIIPMTGVPLPLISYGGSAMLAILSGLGILANISKQSGTR
jgi:cell division protein FtsW